MNVSVIITTYNHPQWLERVVWGYEVQTHRRFEIVIADDGSDDVTRQTIERLRVETSLPIRHVWHEDQGFRKCEILNKAIWAASHSYLLFTDGDCVPRRDFLAEHVRLAELGRFLSGGVVRLPKRLSKRIDKESIQAGNAIDREWLLQGGLRWDRRILRLTRNARLAELLDRITTTRPTFNGHNVSAWRSDVVRVNGFDENMKYGGLDRELGERLLNAGIQGKQVRHRAVAIHLYHSRGYVTAEGWKNNNAIRALTRRNRSTWTERGLDQHHPNAKVASSRLPRSDSARRVADCGRLAQVMPVGPSST
jgi:glycosyltransferase involved in cell wall biosynthesis